MATKKAGKLVCRIRYVKNYKGMGEHYVFENKRPDEKEWGLDTAFKLFPFNRGDGEAVMLNYQALTKIRELQEKGIDFYFGGDENVNEDNG